MKSKEYNENVKKNQAYWKPVYTENLFILKTCLYWKPVYTEPPFFWDQVYVWNRQVFSLYMLF